MAEQGNANRYGTLAVAQEKRFRMHAGSEVPTADVQTKVMEDVIKFCSASWGEKEKKLLLTYTRTITRNEGRR